MTEAVLEAEHLARTFDRGRFQAVADVSLRVGAGQVHALLGPNGAGKTTTVRMCATLLLPTSGSVRVDGVDAVAHPRRARRRLGLVLGGDLGFYPRASARQNLLFFADLQGVARGERASAVDGALERVGLSDAADRRASALSRGMRQRLHLARALLGRPRLLLLDEPTNGLDPDISLQVRQTVAEIAASGVGVLLTSHTMPEIEELADTISVIGAGRIEVRGTVADVARHAGVLAVTTLTLPGRAAGLDEELRGVLGRGVVVTQRPSSSNWALTVSWPVDGGQQAVDAGRRALSALLERHGLGEPDDLLTRPASLEQAYLALARRLDR
ncbi:ABC transporter ATP-binding protein [Actinomyces sp. HMT897]|uniref:ABC transporter ATP-binding protein n=1 Tax=Actinomyces sp. HMT897 TaxID=2789424 RepID=UPI00190B0A6A|nr:ABC transporter ATP-binding protein [Actinomyces sp. HMT897]QQO76870.1 ABC transporter ATP-binding protein [Actinomyces sp. HMT897]